MSNFEEVGELPAPTPPARTGTYYAPDEVDPFEVGDFPTIDLVTGVGRIKLQGILKKYLAKSRESERQAAMTLLQPNRHGEREIWRQM